MNETGTRTNKGKTKVYAASTLTALPSELSKDAESALCPVRPVVRTHAKIRPPLAARRSKYD